MNLRTPLCGALLVGLLATAHAAPAAGGTDAADLSLEDLLKTEVVTVSRKAESLQTTAAAAFVITREDIERSGATSIPEALRMAPGIAVARMANNRWAVTARGFNGRFANKLLVLMDGRSIYSPLFSGVVWEIEDTLLEDVERIEVIRGPGAALWGANAVNGVINIITRKARDTQGSLTVGRLGTADSALSAFRHGGEVADGHYRLWGKGFSGGTSVDADGQPGNDDWRSARFGLRRDGSLSGGQRFTLGGEVYGSPTGDRWNFADVAAPQGFTSSEVRQSARGGHLLGRREWVQDDGSEAALQSYAEHGVIEVSNVLRQRRTTLDVDFQHRTRLVDLHDLVWGLGYRHSTDHIDSRGILVIAPQERRFTLASAFVQDEFSLLADRLRLIFGARLEHNNFTGWEPQPNLRMVWTPAPNQSVWAALSRAARTPSRAENDAQIDLGVTPASPPALPLPILLRNIPSPAGLEQAETVKTLELGHRRQLQANLSLDLTAFYSDYHDLRSARLGGQQVVAGPVPYVLQEITPNNGLAARTRGLELAVEWQPAPWWRLQSNYSHLRVSGRSTTGDPVNQIDASSLGGTTPRHQVSLRSAMSFSGRRQWDVWLRHVSKLTTIDELGNPAPIPEYTALDMRWAWRPIPALELSLVGQNLLERRHAEFLPDFLPSQALLVERGVYVKAKYQF